MWLWNCPSQFSPHRLPPLTLCLVTCEILFKEIRVLPNHKASKRPKLGHSKHNNILQLHLSTFNSSCQKWPYLDSTYSPSPFFELVEHPNVFENLCSNGQHGHLLMQIHTLSFDDRCHLWVNIYFLLVDKDNAYDKDSNPQIYKIWFLYLVDNKLFKKHFISCKISTMYVTQLAKRWDMIKTGNTNRYPCVIIMDLNYFD